MGASYPSAYGGTRRGALLAQRGGTVASPIATLTGTTGSLFTLPAAIVVPAGSIPDHGRVRVRAKLKRTGANGTAQFDSYLGTAGTASDSLLARVQANATDGHAVVMEGEAVFSTSLTTFISQGTAAPQNSGGGASMADRSTNVNRAATMYVTLGLSTANALDSFALLDYKVWLE